MAKEANTGVDVGAKQEGKEGGGREREEQQIGRREIKWKKKLKRAKRTRWIAMEAACEKPRDKNTQGGVIKFTATKTVAS